METSQYVDYILDQTVSILAIDSPSSYSKEVTSYLIDTYRAMGYNAIHTVKGGVLVDLGGRDEDNALVMEAHADTLGAMVAEIMNNGRLRLSRIGGMNPNNAESENCHVITRSGKNMKVLFS